MSSTLSLSDPARFQIISYKLNISRQLGSSLEPSDCLRFSSEVSDRLPELSLLYIFEFDTLLIVSRSLNTSRILKSSKYFQVFFRYIGNLFKLSLNLSDRLQIIFNSSWQLEFTLDCWDRLQTVHIVSKSLRSFDRIPQIVFRLFTIPRNVSGSFR